MENGNYTPSAYQASVAQWCVRVFGEEIAKNVKTRAARFLEEAVELAQALHLSDEDIRKVVEYVLGRPVGEPSQEVGGVMVTLAALCAAIGEDMEACGDRERIRCMHPDVIAKIRAKQKNKVNPDDVLPAQHTDDYAVTEFAAAMRAKMKLSREKGRNGWQGADPAFLRVLMTEHIRKGDPVDVANFCMMLWQLGEETGIVYRSTQAGAWSEQPLNQPMPANFPAAIKGYIENAVADDARERDLIPDEPAFHVNSSRNVAVADDVCYFPMESCPRNVKVLLLGQGGVAVLATYDGHDTFWKGWYPLPKERKA